MILMPKDNDIWGKKKKKEKRKKFQVPYPDWRNC